MIWTGDTPKGTEFSMHCREGTSDENICRLIASMDEYGLAAYTFEGYAIDVGAHIGAVTVPLLIDNPKLNVLAIEPVAENVEALRDNLKLNGLEKRAVVMPLAAGHGGQTEIRTGWAGRHRFVGNIDAGRPKSRTTVPAMALGSLIRVTGQDTIELLKLDCEGCESDVLADPDLWKVDVIVGEFHGHDQTRAAVNIRELTVRTHRVTFKDWVFLAVPK